MSDLPRPSRPTDWPGLILVGAMLTFAFEDCEAALRKRERKEGPFSLDPEKHVYTNGFGVGIDAETGQPIPADEEQECSPVESDGLELDAHSETADLLHSFCMDPEIVLRLLMPLANGTVDVMLPHAERRPHNLRYSDDEPEGWTNPVRYSDIHPGFEVEVEEPKRGVVSATLSRPLLEASMLHWSTEITLHWLDERPIVSTELDAEFWQGLRRRVQLAVPQA